MKTFARKLLAPAVISALCVYGSASAGVYSGGGFGGGGNVYSLLTIKSDGSSILTMTTVQPRAMVEQQVRMMERYQEMSERAGEDENDAAAKPAVTSTNETKAFTDDELVKKLTSGMEDNEEESSDKIEVKPGKDTVTTISTKSFLSLEEMLQGSSMFLREGPLMLENARLEMDTNGLLRLTLTPQTGMERYFKTYRSAWKLSGAKTELKLVFPGRVVSSGFPAMQTNATWLAADGTKDETLDAVAKLYGAPIVITAEPAGLKLEKPLEARALWRSRGQSHGAGSDLPITDAGPGFVAEAQSLTTTSLHVFPGGGEYFSQNQVSTGAVVNVKLFAPKGRSMKSVSNPRVIAAVDNQGRPVAAEGGDDEDTTVETEEFGPRQGKDAASAQFELKLQLPQADAQSIDKLSAEAVAVTVGGWKEITLTNLQENASNELDLAEILPGAKMTIEKLSQKKQQFNIQAKIKGPPSVQLLEVRAMLPGDEDFNSNSSERQSRVKGGQATRTLQINGYSFNEGAPTSPQALVLKIRYPEDIKRERVKLDLKGLDLF